MLRSDRPKPFSRSTQAVSKTIPAVIETRKRGLGQIARVVLAGAIHSAPPLATQPSWLATIAHSILSLAFDSASDSPQRKNRDRGLGEIIEGNGLNWDREDRADGPNGSARKYDVVSFLALFVMRCGGLAPRSSTSVPRGNLPASFDHRPRWLPVRAIVPNCGTRSIRLNVRRASCELRACTRKRR